MKVFFLHSGNERFVQNDIELLSSFSTVNEYFAFRKFPVGFTKYFIGIWKSDIIYCWFASWNSFWGLLIGKMMNKPSILVVGGYDVANMPSIKYGNQRGGIIKWVSIWAMMLATKIITFSNYGKEEVKQNVGAIGKNVEVIYLGVPDNSRDILSLEHRRNVLTVGNIDKANLWRKGLEPFVRTAKLLPDFQFVVVGKWCDDSIEHLKKIASPNVYFTGRVSDQELQDYFESSSVYVQPSAHEGFGLSVAEAMLAGCIPVVTKVGSLPEVVGETGLYSESSEPEDLANKILEAVTFGLPQRQLVRNYVRRNFSFEVRKSKIEAIIESALSNN